MTELTPADYEVDVDRVMAALGVEPGMVVPNSARLGLIDGKIVAEYTVRRAVPPRIMGMALLAGAAVPQIDQPQEQAEDQEGGEDREPGS